MAQTESHDQLADLYTEGGTLLTFRLSQRAHDRYQAALWYCWGRQDAGDERTRTMDVSEPLGADFAFAAFAALEAERFERQQVCMLNNIGDQYARFVAGER